MNYSQVIEQSSKEMANFLKKTLFLLQQLIAELIFDKIEVVSYLKAMRIWF